MKETVAASLDETGADKALLVGHSAGGWLARAALGEGAWEEGVASEDVVAGNALSSCLCLPCTYIHMRLFLHAKGFE